VGARGLTAEADALELEENEALGEGEVAAGHRFRAEVVQGARAVGEHEMSRMHCTIVDALRNFWPLYFMYVKVRWKELERWDMAKEGIAEIIWIAAGLRKSLRR
jgi:hypothetical protein